MPGVQGSRDHRVPLLPGAASCSTGLQAAAGYMHRAGMFLQAAELQAGAVPCLTNLLGLHRGCVSPALLAVACALPLNVGL